MLRTIFFYYQKMADGYTKNNFNLYYDYNYNSFPLGKKKKTFDPCMRLRQSWIQEDNKDKIPDGTCGLHSIEKVSGDCCDSASIQRMWSQTTAWKSLQSHARSNSPTTTRSRTCFCSDRQVISFCAQTKENTYLRLKKKFKISPETLQYATCLFIIMSLTFSTATDSNQSEKARECFIVNEQWCAIS